VSLRCLISSLRLSRSKSVLARQTSVDNTARFCAGWCSDLASRYRSVYVGFLYTKCPSEPSGLLFTNTSRNGRVSCFSTVKQGTLHHDIALPYGNTRPMQEYILMDPFLCTWYLKVHYILSSKAITA